MIKYRDHMINDQIRCAICHADINSTTPLFQSKVNYGIICPKCMLLFNQEEIDIAINLFIIYGGYYGQYKEEQFSIIEHLVEIVEDEGENLNLESVNMKLLHLALIHGITPKEFNQSLELLLK